MTLIEANRSVGMDRLMEAVWDDAPPATAKAQVQICISMLRRMLTEAGLPPDVISTTSNGYMARVPADQLDSLAFADLTRRAHQAVAEHRLAEADELFRTATGLWRGHGLTTGNSRILKGVDVRLVQELVGAVEQWTDVRLRLGTHHGLVGYLTELVSHHPLREGLRVRLMRVLYQSGQQAEALEVYRSGRRLLVDELGIEPGEELQALERAILSGSPDPAPRPVALPSTVPMPEVTPRQLPTDIQDFTGHTEPVRQLRQHLLSRGDSPYSVPVVVVCGKAGVGKTTLATHVGHLLADEFPDGQLFVQLNSLSVQPVTVAQALERFLRALGVTGSAIPERLEERAELYRQLLAHRRILVVLDDAVDEEQVRWLVPGSAGCAVMVTSRFRLTGQPGVTTVNVHIFDQEEAMRLLVKVIGSDRAYAELSECLRLVEICGGLPIGLRIAGARLASRPHWSIGRFVERIADETQRLHELVYRGLGVRATLALTYKVLSETAQRLFRRLAMLEVHDFPGWLAAPLLDTSVHEGEEALEELIDAQFVDVERLGRSGRLRFRLHDLIRTYARERLAHDDSPAERAAALDRALGAWLYFAEQAHRREYGGDHTLLHGSAERWPLPDIVIERELVDPIQWYESERHGIVAAVCQAARAGLDELCWDLALTSVTLFEAHSFFDDWRVTHEMALAECRRAANRRGEAAMLHSLGALRLFEQRFTEAGWLLRPAQHIFTEVGDRHGQALVLRNLAFLDRAQGRMADATRRCEQALPLLRAAGDAVGEAHVLGSMAQIQLERGDADAAEQQLTRALELVHATGSRRIRCQLLCRLGDLQLAQQDETAAEETFRNVIKLVQEYGDKVGEMYARYGLGVALARQQRTDEAEAELVKVQDQASYLPHRMLGGQIRMVRGGIHLERGMADLALELFSQAQQIFAELEMDTWRVRALLAVGDAYRSRGQSEAASMAWRESLALADKLDPKIVRPVAEELRARTR
ncbi:BTAD domain-containing putative transcriptional regulator [Micromonospora sp. WMMD1102]|uniref:AfsR/SARP family transcriptional regulator n=1 Tax=Micromonospora sp. WMMD1102 TaxID=3016105 RepID=UPI0024151077|nr:BTAD domain-containing putative transcriptional regulator [Micromonospora sp. WMMD1102]MDG4785105.1 BTAD domain-containing putative transcriptional regulator [Micromonospora sp. WMMD1102]